MFFILISSLSCVSGFFISSSIQPAVDTALYLFIPEQRRGYSCTLPPISFLFLDSEPVAGISSHHCPWQWPGLYFFGIEMLKFLTRWRDKCFLFLSSSPSAGFHPHFNAGKVKAGGIRRRDIFYNMRIYPFFFH